MIHENKNKKSKKTVENGTKRGMCLIKKKKKNRFFDVVGFYLLIFFFL